jgi:transposase
MTKTIMIGCDLHDRSMLLRFAVDSQPPKQKSFANNAEGRDAMIAMFLTLAKETKADRIVFAYEASGLGFGLADLLEDRGITCCVLSPTKLEKTPKSAKQKTDAKDAQMLLEKLRGHILAGNELPVVWTPPHRLRDDRELVRARIDIADETTRVKLKILTMLKRRGLEKPNGFSTSWSKRWLKALLELAANLDRMVGIVLESLVRQYEVLRDETTRLEKRVRELSRTPRYVHAHDALREFPGVGLLTAMTFLTEMGDLTRFHNRREVAAYMGLCPASFESGEVTDRKGRITRQGPSRLRRMLCQAVWSSLARSEEALAAYERIKGGKKNRNKKAVVALMRQLGIKLWHRAMECGVSAELIGRGGPHDVRTSAQAQQRGAVPIDSPSPRPQARAG